MSGHKILIIDDDQPLLVGLTARLKANGYSVVCAADAVSAARRCQTWSSSISDCQPATVSWSWNG